MSKLADYDRMDAPATFVPEHDREAIRHYIEYGIIPGSFLRAVIRNDLREAVGQADYINQEALPTIVAWFYNHAPALCWGNPSRVEMWQKFHAKCREAAQP